MKRPLRFTVYLLLCCAVIPSQAQEKSEINTPTHRAWDLLTTAIFSKNIVDRTNGVRALGLLRDDARAREYAEYALDDPKPEVRSAAATALGQMHAIDSIPKLRGTLNDRKIPVVIAAAQSLRLLQDEEAAYVVYYELLTGVRKSSDGLIAQQIETLKNPRELAKIGFSEGIGYIPFAGIGWDAYRTMHKKDPNPVRAVAATFLAHDPDPATSKALVKAVNDKDWIVRAAAIEAIAQRGDASLLPKVEPKFKDKHPKVRYSAAAAVIRLSKEEQEKTAKAP